jgi:addiction module RelB/DinJ family antitoxin
MPTVQLRTRLDRKLKEKSEALLKSLGLDSATFFAMSLAQLVNRRGLPFAVTESDEEYFQNEYGLNVSEAAKAGRRMKSETARARRAGKLKEISTSDDLKP